MTKGEATNRIKIRWRRKDLIGTLLRTLERFTIGVTAMTLWGRGRAAWLQNAIDEEELEEGLHAPNTTGIPEADLTEEQRREAVRRIKNKPCIG